MTWCELLILKKNSNILISGLHSVMLKIKYESKKIRIVISFSLFSNISKVSLKYKVNFDEAWRVLFWLG